MVNIYDEDPIILGIGSMLDNLYEKVDELIVRQEKQLEDCKRKDELESKLAQELKLNAELQARARELEARGGSASAAAERLGERLGERLRLAPTDLQRLQTARDMLALGKELTGVRWDYSAPPDLARGYIKSESRKWLRSFCVQWGAAGEGDGALWDLLLDGDKENQPSSH